MQVMKKMVLLIGGNMRCKKCGATFKQPDEFKNMEEKEYLQEMARLKRGEYLHIGCGGEVELYNLFNNIRKHLMLYRISYVRVSGYMQMVMLATVLFKQFNLPLRWLPVGFIVIWLMIGVAGFLDYKLGFHSEELKITTKRNPVIQELIEEVRELNERLSSTT